MHMQVLTKMLRKLGFGEGGNDDSVGLTKRIQKSQQFLLLAFCLCKSGLPSFPVYNTSSKHCFGYGIAKIHHFLKHPVTYC